MRTGSDNLKDVLTSSLTPRFFCDIFYGPTRTISDLPIERPQFKWNKESRTIGSASVQVTYTPEFDESMGSMEFSDLLAPVGAEANLFVEISGRAFTETVQLGRYRIAAAPTAREEHMDFMGQVLVSGSTLTLTLLDRSDKVYRAGFRTPETPPVLTSCWTEIARITGAQVVKTVPDQPIPTSIVYEANRGGRWKAVTDLASVLGGTAYFNSFGALTVLPDGPIDVNLKLVLGAQGTIMDVDYSMDSEGLYNEVVGNFEDDNRNPIYALAQITSGRLSVNGEYGHNTIYVASPLVKTQAAADAFVRTRLFNLSSQQTYRVPVQCIYNPLAEVGDVASIERPGTTVPIVGEIISIDVGDDGLMSIELEVIRTIS